jgi:hypothetical protein
VINYYAATFEFPWRETISCLLTEVGESSAIVEKGYIEGLVMLSYTDVGDVTGRVPAGQRQ